MTTSIIHYDLQDGYIHTWLVVGPQALRLENDYKDPDARLRIAQAHAEAELEIVDQPVEPATLSEGLVAFDGYEGRWQVVHCLEDHLVDLSGATASKRGYLRTWAYTELESATAQTVTLVLTTTGSAYVWVNGAQCHREVRVDDTLRGVAFEVALREGRNPVFVRFEHQAAGPAAYAMALQVVTASLDTRSQLAVAVPTHITPVERRNRLEAFFEAARVRQYVFSREDSIVVEWPTDESPELVSDQPISEQPTSEQSASEQAASEQAASGTPSAITVRVQTEAGRVYTETNRTKLTENQMHLGRTFRFPDGALEVLLMPHVQEYYKGNMRVSRKIPIWGLDNNKHTATPAGTFTERRKDTLIAAARRETGIYSELAKMAVGWWSRLEPTTIAHTIEQVRQSDSPAFAECLGLLTMVLRFGDAEAFPEGVPQQIAETVVHVDYARTAIHAPESQELVAATCELLAGQLVPDEVFVASGEPGRRHREWGEARALAWMRTRATHGFEAWNSDEVTAETVSALALLIDFADAEAVWQTATVLLDKLLFLLAVNSYQGVFGSSRGRTSTAGVLGGYLDGAAGIGKLMWGMGVHTPHTAAPVSLALMEEYGLPVMLQVIAADLPESLWSREHHGLTGNDGEGSGGVDQVTYKTPDFMLSAAQDYRPGTRGSQEHVWQATLGPGATVFVNHPVCASLDETRRPNFWRGNGVLPRVVQWQDALIALYDLPASDWMGFTHAYFPIHAFDAHVLRNGWAFARKGEGYLALTTAQGMRLLRDGPSAYRELRSVGHQHVWLCQMGRAALDGDFEAFQEKVLAMPVAFESLAVRWTTLRGDELALAWTGPFLKNGEPIPLHGHNHVENAYCVAEFPAHTMDIRHGDVIMRLDFETQEL